MDSGSNRGSEGNLRRNYGDAPASNNSGLGQTSRPVTRSMRQSILEPIPDNSNRRRRTATSSIDSAQGAGSQSRESSVLPTGENASTSSSRHSASPTSPPSSRRRRAKRRKLDSEDTQEGIQGFKYGHYGQVVSTPLEMEISACDEPPSSTKPLAQNILLNNRSVYYSDDNRCSFILGHRGDGPFCLKKLVIRTPTSGLDAPSSVREGMVFVSMAKDEVFNRTARYQLTYPENPWPQRTCDPSARRYFDVIQSLLTSPPRGSADAPRPSSSGQQEQSSDLNVTMEQDDKTEDESFDNDNRQDGISLSDLEDTHFDQPPEAPNPGDAEEDDNISGLVEALSQHLDVRQQRLLEALGVTEPFIRLRSRTFHQMRYSQPQTILVPPRGMDAAGPSSTSPSSMQLMKPHARFYIEKDKNMVSIKFDPPASGRFILLKFWTPFSRGMEIQNVIAHGFMGPRYFPAVQFR